MHKDSSGSLASCCFLRALRASPKPVYGSREVPTPLVVFLLRRSASGPPGSSPGQAQSQAESQAEGDRDKSVLKHGSPFCFFSSSSPGKIVKSRREIRALTGVKAAEAGRSFASSTGLRLIVCGWQQPVSFNTVSLSYKLLIWQPNSLVTTNFFLFRHRSGVFFHNCWGETLPVS